MVFQQPARLLMQFFPQKRHFHTGSSRHRSSRGLGRCCQNRVLDFVDPARAGGRALGRRWKTRLNKRKHTHVRVLGHRPTSSTFLSPARRGAPRRVRGGLRAVGQPPHRLSTDLCTYACGRARLLGTELRLRYAVGNDRIAVIADKPYFDQLTTAAFLAPLVRLPEQTPAQKASAGCETLNRPVKRTRRRDGSRKMPAPRTRSAHPKNKEASLTVRSGPPFCAPRGQWHDTRRTRSLVISPAPARLLR
jgi:hypothetical protein